MLESFGVRFRGDACRCFLVFVGTGAGVVERDRLRFGAGVDEWEFLAFGAIVALLLENDPWVSSPWTPTASGLWIVIVLRRNNK